MVSRRVWEGSAWKGVMWHVTYVGLVRGDRWPVRQRVARGRSTLLRLLRQSRYRRRKANRDQTGIKCGEGEHREWAWGRVSKRLLQKGYMDV